MGSQQGRASFSTDGRAVPRIRGVLKVARASRSHEWQARHSRYVFGNCSFQGLEVCGGTPLFSGACRLHKHPDTFSFCEVEQFSGGAGGLFCALFPFLDGGWADVENGG